MTDLARKIADLDPEQLEFLRRRLAKSARKQGEETGPAGLPRVPRRPQGGDPPLSFAQQRLWFLHRLQASAAAYHIPISVDLRGVLVPAALRAALAGVVRRHEALRTAFPLAGGRPLQVVSREARASLSWVDLSGIGAPARDAELARLGEEEGLRPFDLERGPLLRGLVVCSEPRRHRLLLTLHHIAADNWSVAVLMREVAELYNAALEGRAPALPEPPVQYADYAVWQRDWLQGAVLERQLGFWREKMAGAAPRLDLPADRPRPAAPSFRSGRQVFRVPADLVREVRALGRSHGTTLYIVLLAAFKALLHRYTGQEDLVVGSPVANRRRPELEGLIGFFVNTLLMRTRVAAEGTFEELLAEVRETALASYAHQDLPFERLVEELRPERDTTYQPLFQVMFNLFDGVLPELRLAGLAVAALEVQIGTWNDLDLLLVDREDGLDGYLRYGADLYDPATIEAFAASFRSVLEQVARAPQARLAELRLAPALAAQAEAARRRDRKRTVAVSATFTADPVEGALSFWMQEMGIPAQVVLAPYSQIFQQLLDPSSLLATNRDGFNVVLVRLEDWVRDRGEEDGRLEAVERNALDLAAAVARAAGRAPVPWVVAVCPPSTAAAADAPFAALQADLARRMAAALEEIPQVDFVGPEELGGLYPELELHDAYADEIGHVPYTAVGFAALATLLARRVSAAIDPPYKVIAVDCDQTLWRGVCAEDGPAGVAVGPAQRRLQELLVERQQAGLLLCLCSKNEERDVWDVFDARPDMPLRREHVAAWRIDWGAKSDNLRALAGELGLGLDSFIFLDDNPVECAEVRAACPEVAVIEIPAEDGAALPGALPGALRAFWGLDRRRTTAEDRRRTTLYRENLERERSRRQAGDFEEFLAGLGLQVDVAPLAEPDLPRAAQLTQRTNQLNTTTVRRSEAEIRSLLAAGELEGRTVRVRDRFGDYGLVGLLLFRTEGDALAVGSLLLSCRVLGRRVEHRLLAHLGEIAGERGLDRVDVPAVPTARNRPALDFLESVAGAWRQEAPAGGRVYRIPTAEALACERRREAAAAAAAEEDERPAAAAGGEAAARTGRLLRFARELADPAEVARRVEAARGRRRSAGAPEAVHTAARTATEQRLAALFAEVLGLESVGAGDSFFAAGGHSLLGVTLLSRVRQAFAVDLPLSALFEAPTVAALAGVVEGLRGQDGEADVPPLLPVPRGGAALPLSFAQRRLWFIDQLEPGSPLYNVPAILRVAGTLRCEVLALCLGEVVRRHEVLRTVFALEDGSPVQVIQPAQPFPLPVVDLTGLPERARETPALALAAEVAARPFDLRRDPLLRGVLLRLAGDDHVVALTMHHIASDGWSMGILVREAAALYPAFLAAQPSPLPELPLQYADFALWQRGWLDAARLEGLAGHWRRRLSGAPPQLDLPGARPRPAVLSPRGAVRRRRFSAPLLEQLHALGRRESATLFMTLLAALQALLHSRTGSTDLVVGTDVAGRDRRETEEMIGFFINQLPLRADLSGDPTLRELLGRVRETALDAFAHQSLPFDHLVETLRVEQSLQRSPVFQVKLVLQNAPRESLELPGLTFQILDLSTGTAQLDLHWSFLESGDELGLHLTYSTDLYDEPLISQLLDQYEAWLRAFVERPGARLGELTAELSQAARSRRTERGLELKSVGHGKLQGLRRQAVEAMEI